MTNEFEKLRDQLRSVEAWLDAFTAQLLSQKEAELAEGLRRYLIRCWKDDRKWRSELSAERARIKIDKVWFALMHIHNERRA